MKAILFDASGKLSIGEASVRSLGSHDIRVAVKAAGVNRADLLQKEGNYPPPPGASEVLGLEVSGLVVEVGEQVTRFRKGDQVMGLLAGGGYAQEVVDDERVFMKVPKGMDLVNAGAIPEAFLTAYQSLFYLARLEEEETVLIHAGASGVGTAAIQLAKQVGARVIVTAGTDEKVDFCQSLGADHGINYKKEDFFDVVKSITEGKGANVVIDVVGGDYLGRNIDCLAVDGRYVLLAFMGGAKADINLGKVLMKRIHLMGSTLRARSLDYKSKLISGFEQRFLHEFATGGLRPVINKTYDWGETEKAHEYMSLNLTMGKLLLRIS